MDVVAVVAQGEGDIGPGEGHTLEFFHDVPEFHLVRFEELTPGGDVVEKVADGEVAAHGAGDLPGAQVLGGGHGYFHAAVGIRRTGAQGDFRHGGDGGQGLPAEAETEDVVQVLSRSQLGGGVALEAQDGVVRGEAAAVVDDLDEGASGIADHHLHVRRAGVHGILHKFLHHGSGALDHLSRGDHIRDILG